MFTFVLFRLGNVKSDCPRIPVKKISIFFSLLLLLSANAWTQCITPTATIAVQPGSNPCNGQSFNLILSSTVTGIAPFDLTINSPAGTATYNDVSPGAVITSFTPPIEKLWPDAPAVIRQPTRMLPSRWA